MDFLNSKKALKMMAYIFSFVFIVLILLPLLYMGSLSLQDDVTIYSYPPHILPVAPKSVSIVIDYSKYRNKSNEVLKDLVLRDSTVAMYSTIYELNKTVIGEIKVYGTLNGKIIYYSRAHGMLLNIERQYGIYKMSSITPQVLFYDNKYLTSVKDIGYTFNPNGILNKKCNASLLGKNEISSIIENNFEGQYKISGDYRGSIVKSNLLLALENYKFYFRLPAYQYPDISSIKKYSFLAFMFNTILTIAWATICQVSLTSLSAYPLSRLLSKKTADRVMMFFLVTLMIPWVCIMIPQLLMMKSFGFDNSYKGMLFPWLLPAPFYIFLFKGFFDKIPSAYFEAAKIDGAGELYTFFKICMPMSKPIISLIALQAFISGWGDFMWYYLVANKPNLWTMNVAMYTMGASTGAVVRENFLMGLSFVTILPILIAVAVFSKQIKASVISAGIKG